MSKKKTREELLKNRRDYRQNAGRFFLSFSAHAKDQEAREWLNAQQDRGTYLKALILADKKARLSSGEDTVDLSVFKNSYDELWDTQFELLKKFYAEYCRWPKFHEKYAGYSIGRWYYKQKKQAESPDQKNREKAGKSRKT